uniref:Reverse transcriptase zinc-binding domain-containing protein n=1 Tax=Fagus sylvatica TaxID=28930 RepID=A0A2N9IJ26_FAGSY
MELNSVTTSLRPRRKHFRFEEMWTMDPSCEETVRQAWVKTQHGTPMYQVTEKIKTSRADLKEWSFTHFGSVRYLIETKSQQLQREEELVPEAQNVPLLKKLREELTILFAKEEKMWKQRSRTQWLQSGDRNTRFFHCQATQRRRRNSIQQLRDNDGVWRSSEAEIEQLLVSYYSDLFTTSSPGDFEEVIDGVKKVVTGEMNDMLVAEFTASEIELALKQMAPLKAPSPDGRLISDNILIAFETLHHMQHMKGGRQGYMALKLDMSKAANLSDCHAIQEVLSKYERASGQQINHGKLLSFLVLPQVQRLGRKFKLHYISLRFNSMTNTWASHPWWVAPRMLPLLILRRGCGPKCRAGKSDYYHSRERGVDQGCHPSYSNIYYELLQASEEAMSGVRETNQELLVGSHGNFKEGSLGQVVVIMSTKINGRGTIMEARCPASASFAWKSIFQARHVIRKGARWRVGNGNSIRVWHDRWIPIPSAGVPVTPPNELPEDACVSSLIQVGTGLWNKELVERIFIPSEASLILSTTLSSRAPNDLLVWGGEKSGKYSVRSAYRMLANVDLEGNPGCFTTEYWRMFWKKIWSVKVPFKIRNFLWRVCINALPTLVKLQRRTIISTARCSFCLAEDEDILHALWTCPLLPLWTPYKLTRKVVRSCYTSLLDVVGHLLEYESDASLAEFAFMLWLVWQRRNKAMYQSELNNLDDIPLLAQRLLLEFWAVNDQQQSVPQVIPKQAWQPPTQLEFKANCDAALFPSHNMTSVGVVIRDGQASLLPRSANASIVCMLWMTPRQLQFEKRSSLPGTLV